MSEHSHDHDHHDGDDAHHDEAFAGNIEIGPDETATDAFSQTHVDLPVFTFEQLVDDIDNFSTWDMDSVTFSFPTEESDDYIGNNREGTLAGFSAAQAAAATQVMALYGDLIDVEFVNSGTDVDAEIRMYNSTIISTAGGAPAGTGIAGDMWIYNYDPETVDSYNLELGGYHYHLLLHEMGHIMGLSHTSFVSGESYAERATYLQNNGAFSQMSYLTAGSAGLAWDTTYAATPMLIDVAALQSLYGANMTTRTGDTVYGFNSTADRLAFDFDTLLDTTGEIGAITVWDAGGTDTFDMSGFGTDGFINLTSGTHSSVGGYDLNVAIAYDAVIENAIGGAGNDVILGNDVNNVLAGGLGQDTLTGGAGDDQLHGDHAIGASADFTHAFATLAGSQAVSHSFDGTDVTQMTIEMLISFDPEATSASWLNDMPGNWILVYEASNNGLWFQADGRWTLTDLRSDNFADGDLHRVSITYDGETNTVQFFLDGELRTTITQDEIAPLDLDALQSITFDHEGSIADVRVFGDLRTAAEIRDNAWSEVAPATDNLLMNIIIETDAALDATSGDQVSITQGALYGSATLVNSDDVLRGGAGNDQLFGGVGDDMMYGDVGADTAIYAGLYGDYAITTNADGSQTVVSTNAADAGTDQLFEVEQLSFADGRLIGDTFTPLTTEVSVVDTDESKAWAVYVDTLDFHGDRISRIMTFDNDKTLTTAYENGLRTSVNAVDTGDAYVWNSYTEGFDANGNRISRTMTFDNERTLTTEYENGLRTSVTSLDPGDVYAWSSYVDDFDTNGNRISRTKTFDNGRTQTTEYENGVRTSISSIDSADVFSWSSYAEDFDANGDRTSRTVTFDNGRTLTTEYENAVRTSINSVDHGDVYAWSSYVEDFDATGARTSRTTVYDDDRELVTNYIDDLM